MQFYQVALLGFVPLTLLLFAMLPARRAMVMAVVGGALFLPEGRGLPIFGFEALGYFKASAITFGCGLGVLLFDTNRLLSFRPRWFDGFAVVLGVTGIISSLTNGLGFRDGIFEAVIAIWLWTIPYFLGRLYFSDLAGIRELAIGIVGGAVAYVPLCLIEIRMSPQLHSWVYGYAQHQFAQSIRFGGYRPVVFLPHGLAVGVYMAVASIIAWWLWSTKSVTRLWGVPSGWVAGVLVATTVLVKSGNGYVFLTVGLGVLYGAKWLRSALPLIVLCAVPLAYCATRATGAFDGQIALTVAEAFLGEARAGSLAYRFEMENRLAARAMERPLFGWGGHGRNRLVSETALGERTVITDGLWIITFGKWGAAGLVSLIATLTLGTWLLPRRFPAWTWSTPQAGAVAPVALAALIHMLDSLPNGMPSAVFCVAAGAAAGLQSLPGVARTAAPAADTRPLWQRRLAQLKGRGRSPAVAASPHTLPGRPVVART